MSSDSLRIGIVCYPTYGGSGAVATELGRALARRGHTIHFISYARPFRLAGDFHENIIFHEISNENYPLFQGQLYTIVAAVKIYEIIRQKRLDVLHLHYALPHAISAWMAMEMLEADRRIPTVTTLHGTDITLVGSKPAFHPAVKLGLDKTDAITCVSKWLATKTCELFAVGNRMSVIYNFVDPEVFTPGGLCCQQRFFDHSSEKIIMHISNFRPVKRILDVIRVFARISASVPARLLMIGDGPDRDAALHMAEELGVADRVAFLGKLPCVQNFLPMADLFLFPSDGESFGLAALEAMACEVPVIGARAGGLPEVVVDGECGVLCPVGDVDAMAAAAVGILRDEDRRRSLGRAGRARAIEHFSAQSVVAQYEAVYTSVLNEEPLESRTITGRGSSSRFL